MSKIKIFESALFVSFVLAIVLSITGFARTCDRIRGDVLRLHVIANSDSDEDQELKLKVRDAVLKAGKNVFDGSVTKENAEEKISAEMSTLRRAAEDTIKENGFGYNVKISVDDEYFETRTYESVTLPAGQYTAVRVVIGSGKGHNWWCVMFPPLCLPAAQTDADIDLYLDKNELKIVKSDPKYEPRFKFIEIYEQIKDKICKNER